jgi:peptidoglycan/LPS O-acetylase OafA/YrhL
MIVMGFRAFIDNFFNPVAAVIVFFLISGFCIHLPYRKQTEMALTPYFTRRFVRILIPMAAAFLLAIPLKVKYSLFSDSILWSLVCEEIYYLLYPLLRLIAGRVTWTGLFCFTFPVAFVVALTTLNKSEITHGIYPALGPQLTWFLGLPCWLLGCVLAERLESFGAASVTFRQIWLWRLDIWLATWVCSVLKFHSPIGYPLTLNVFAILAFFWLQREIAYYRVRKPTYLFEKAGAWSYSMYLMHLHAQATYVLIGLPVLLFPLGWTVHLAFLLCVCYVFYLIVEAPSHKLARQLAKHISARNEYSIMTMPSAIGEPEV